ncbi:single-minded 1-A [Dichotomopilus funicola]|uniref:Single-minded 1-A n=1 Tax=Dichotomopilus funicola TaxID=1934379 RepID=A0AAN6ZQ46_9PEZI|nr:single-minded 1-A [Dichotomopilus funicola]
MDPREQTFMTIHNLTPDANILFASDSILDILGYQPDEVRGKSAFEYFHPNEVPFARSIHSRGVLLDKAAVLHYARILAKSGQWMSCECCFTVVHNVLVASTSIYFKGERSERRARDAPQIRRIFRSSPRDPRYHMLEHLSPKFKMPPMEREPRAALILNRFTRNLTIMYATDAVAQILGLRPDELLEKPFYECIQPNCLDEAERCLESAKANESIAYLRFWYKDPRIDPNAPANQLEDVNRMEDDEEVDDEDDEESTRSQSEVDVKDPTLIRNDMELDEQSRPLGRGDINENPGSMDGVRQRSPPRRSPQTFELEAVVSCTSDGLVVVLRRARPRIPDPQPAAEPSGLEFENGLFAAPWALQRIEPYISPERLYNFRPPLLPQYMPLRECVKAAGGPPLDQLMRSIRDVAVFAWAVTGINPDLAANYAQGSASGRNTTLGPGQPALDGLSEWSSDSLPTTYPPLENTSRAPSAATERAERAERAERLLKDQPSLFGHSSLVGTSSSGPHTTSEPPPLYRTRHASWDESMYDAGSEHLERPGPGAYNQCHEHHGNQYHHAARRSSLRPAFSYDALQDHARHQHQAAFGLTSSAGVRRGCGAGYPNLGKGQGGNGEGRRGGGSGTGSGSGGPGDGWVIRGGGGDFGGSGTGGAESSKTAEARGRYFWR